MLFCDYNDALSVLPALPERLASGAVRGICFPGGKADILWDASGRVDVTVYAERDLDTMILIGGRTCVEVVLAVGRSETYSCMH